MAKSGLGRYNDQRDMASAKGRIGAGFIKHKRQQSVILENGAVNEGLDVVYEPDIDLG